MREIKFRYVFDKIENGRNTGIGIEYHSQEEIEKGKLEWIHYRAQSWILKSRDQFTGLKDKNGKEIYEGDVIYYAGTQAIVKFDNGAFRTIYQLKQEMTPILQKQNQQQYEIIGNIYENPEMVKEK